MAETSLPAPAAQTEPTNELAAHWRSLTRAATLVAVLTSPAVYMWFHVEAGWAWYWSLLAAAVAVAMFRGLLEVGFRKVIPWPTLFGADARLQEEDLVARRRAWYWRQKYMHLMVYAAIIGIALLVAWAWRYFFPGQGTVLEQSLVQNLPNILFFPLYFIANFAFFFGPFLLMAVSQISSYEPGEADWGVRLDDVRGQAEAKEEVRQVVTLWQSGEVFEAAGGKRERGLLMLGAPGTGKTMLSKAIATGFNCPFVSIPGSGFAGMFLGMDAITVRLLARRAKRLARKWGGQCIVFIDEIDAVGMRRASLGAGFESSVQPTIHDVCFFGPQGSITPSGDLILETREWRDRLFAARQPRVEPRGPLAAANRIANQAIPGGLFGGGQLALNQLLVVMDGIGNPPWFRKTMTNRMNTFLDAMFIIPRSVRGRSLRLPRPRPRSEQIYFIGACNAPIEALDPALTRPGRMGRHVWFRTPTKDDRLDIFDLYLGKVAHDSDLDDAARRDELARITNGYSPAMIEQVCSMALTRAHFDGRLECSREDVVESLTTVESGTAVNIEYVPEETRAVAIHEAGHAVASHVYLTAFESTRLSIRKRGGSLGHHQARAKEERFSEWRHERFAALVHTLGAMAAERVFYGENSMGVGGDVMSVTAQASLMVGAAAMGPDMVDVSPLELDAEEAEQAEARIAKRYERIGVQIMRRSGSGGPFQADPIAGVLSDRDKRQMVAQLLGQAYVTAYNVIQANREAVERIAEELIRRREMYGDEVLELLDSAGLERPEIDPLKEESWPQAA
ncbi:MAG TPA: AAA family ATPase [Gaiellales bacterium]|nr:AAA family ATPase [Gaiellales bacterium]